MTTHSLQVVLRRIKAEIRGVFFISCFINLLALTASIYMLQVFDRVLSSGSLATLGYLTLIAVAALGALAVLELSRKRILTCTGHWFEAAASPSVLAAGNDDIIGGRAPQAGLKDVADIRSFLAGDSVSAFLDAPWVVVFVIVLFLLHPWFGLIAAIGAAALFACALLNDALTRRGMREQRSSFERVTLAARELHENAEVLRALGMQRPAFERWRSRIQVMLPSTLQTLETGAYVGALSRFLRLSLQIMVLGTGAFLVLDHELTAGGMIAASIILARALAPVERSIQAWHAFVAARSAYEALKPLIGRPPAKERVRLPSPSGRIMVREVHYAPERPDRTILRNVSLALETGECLGIIGPSGSGKSTLCRLLVGALRPTYGSVRIDGAEVADHVTQLSPHIGYLPQEISFLSGTVAENIARLQQVDPAALVEAATEAGVHDMILSLSDGYETPLETIGPRLSGGQRQGLALARALYGIPRLLILDEPNSNLDAQGENALIQTLADAKDAGVTIVVVAHQPSLMRHCDKLLMLQKGAVAAFGPRDEILAKVTAGRPRPRTARA